MTTLIVYSGASSYHRCNCLRGFCYCGCASRSSGQYYPNHLIGNILTAIIVILISRTWHWWSWPWHTWLGSRWDLTDQVEWMARLDFLWQLQARDEKLDMEALQVGTCLTYLFATCASSHCHHHRCPIIRVPIVGFCSICFLLMWQLTSWTTSSAATW